MSKIKRTFIGSRMQKDVDERLVKSGEYIHAENICIANTDSSDMGAVENVKGNEKLTQFNLTNAKTLGAFSDDSNQKLYWFTTSDEKDLVVEYDVSNTLTTVLLESTNPNGLLNFDKNHLITGVVKIINGDSNRDLLIWTDDINPPRMINIERAKTYTIDGFIEDDISLIKKPPRFAPKVNLTFTASTLENNLEDKFLSFAYRYKYLDGEYSAVSSFSNYKFAPKQFDLDYQTMENNGMVNSFNAVDILFNTGDERVTDIELLFKESNSNQLSVIERFNKKEEIASGNWSIGHNNIETFQFANSKKYTSLPEDELFRTFDNVPRLAKALDIIGSRIVFGNYVEGYNLTDLSGQDIHIDYDVSTIHKDLSGEPISTDLSITQITDDTWDIDLTNINLVSGARLVFNVDLNEKDNDGTFNYIFDFILNRDYTDAQDLASDSDFLFFIESIMTNKFLQSYTNTPPANSQVDSSVNFTIVNSTATSINIQAPIIEYGIYDYSDPNNPVLLNTEFHNWYFKVNSNMFFKKIAVDNSLKTNRSYEVGIIYMDEYGRTTTVLTAPNNTQYIDQQYSTFQNKLMVNINHEPPYWADRYKMVVKQNKGDYHTIYTSLFYEDDMFRWVLLEGNNKDKVKVGDILIVKSDMSGAVNIPIKVQVLDIVSKNADFLENNVDELGNPIIEKDGLYMKIRPHEFVMNYNDFSFYEYERYYATYNNPAINVFVGVNDNITEGATINILIDSWEKNRGNNWWGYEKSFIAENNYVNFKEFFDAQIANTNEFIQFASNHINYSFNGTSDSIFYIQSKEDGYGVNGDRSIYCKITIQNTSNIIFETEPKDVDSNIFYETEQTFEIIDGKHQGNITNQTLLPATIELDFFNCYIQGNGAESYRYKDGFNTHKLNIDLRPSSTSIEKYKEVRRYADLTYSEVYNENNNLNGINEFNLAKANFKEDIDKKYGYIQKLYSRDTDILVFQEDKISKVLYGKNLLMNADGTSNVSSIEDVLGQQVTFKGEYGISRNPESFAFDGYHIYFTDSKRGAVMRLGNNGLEEISRYGLRQFFKDEFKDSIDNEKLGAFDPYQDQYVLHPSLNRVSLPVSISCQESVTRANFSGELIINIDYDLFIGEASIDYEIINGGSANIKVEWDDNVVFSQIVNGNDTIYFQKTKSIPTTAKVTITAVDCINFEIGGKCIEPQNLTIVNVVLNDENDENLTIKSRYKWQNGNYISPFITYNSLFGIGEVDKYEIISGAEGVGAIPATGSTIYLESYNGSNETAEFSEYNKLGYFISNTLYSESNYQTLINNAIFPTVTENVLPSGDISNSILFNFNRPNNEQYLYLIWNYIDN